MCLCYCIIATLSHNGLKLRKLRDYLQAIEREKLSFDSWPTSKISEVEGVKFFCYLLTHLLHGVEYYLKN
jgi:hypothetical protein